MQTVFIVSLFSSLSSGSVCLGPLSYCFVALKQVNVGSPWLRKSSAINFISTMSGAQGLVKTPIYFLTQLLFVPCLNNIRPSCAAVPPWRSQIPSVSPVFLTPGRYNGVTAESAGPLIKLRVLSHPSQHAVPFTPEPSLQLYRPPSTNTSLHPSAI